MNKRWYSYGNPCKVKFRKHRCHQCGTKLSVVKHRKIVDPKSEEAKYYDFDAEGDGGIMVGACEFIHKVFYCPSCSESIEFVTQLNLEDIDIIVNKVKKHFGKRGRNISISKSFEMRNGSPSVSGGDIADVRYLCLSVQESGKEDFVYEVPLCEKESWERPHYFDISQKKLIKLIAEHDKL